MRIGKWLCEHNVCCLNMKPRVKISRMHIKLDGVAQAIPVERQGNHGKIKSTKRGVCKRGWEMLPKTRSHLRTDTYPHAGTHTYTYTIPNTPHAYTHKHITHTYVQTPYIPRTHIPHHTCTTHTHHIRTIYTYQIYTHYTDSTHLTQHTQHICNTQHTNITCRTHAHTTHL